VTDRKKKILLIQILIFISAVLLLYFTYSNKNGSLDSSKAIKPIENEPIQEGNDKKKSNRFENVEYKGVDLNGNRYVINSKIADFELEKPELINMDIMSAVFYFKDGTVLKVKGDYGSYNNKTKDMKFRDNIVAEYNENFLYADNLDYLNSKNLLNIYKNVKTKSNQGNIIADKLEFDISKQTLDISMFDENLVDVKLRKQ
tara:strand:+ start:785 stop:1387 length:603 start_codon:yes stop_codon:yes gene_type:complete